MLIYFCTFFVCLFFVQIAGSLLLCQGQYYTILTWKGNQFWQDLAKVTLLFLWNNPPPLPKQNSNNNKKKTACTHTLYLFNISEAKQETKRRPFLQVLKCISELTRTAECKHGISSTHFHLFQNFRAEWRFKSCSTASILVSRTHEEYTSKSGKEGKWTSLGLWRRVTSHLRSVFSSENKGWRDPGI